MTISENRSRILQDIEIYHPSAKLVAVSKRQPQQRLKEALMVGQRVFGENRVQEAEEHWQAYRDDYPDLELHLIGPLQTNKVKQAVALFDVIQVVDREKLAKALAAEMQEQQRFLPCLIQVNTGEEEQKSGILPQETAPFIAFCKNECHLDIKGLMCIPPFDEPASLHFALLQKLAAENGLKELSMGMSSDYEQALKLGSTMIRVGTTFFGQREE